MSAHRAGEIASDIHLNNLQWACRTTTEVSSSRLAIFHLTAGCNEGQKIPTIGLIDYTRVVCLREACTRVNLARLECIKGKLSRASPDEINRLAGELCKEERRLFRLQNAIVSYKF